MGMPFFKNGHDTMSITIISTTESRTKNIKKSRNNIFLKYIFLLCKKKTYWNIPKFVKISILVNETYYILNNYNIVGWSEIKFKSLLKYSSDSFKGRLYC